MNDSNYYTYTRRARHAGSWYSDDESTLDATLSSYLAAAAKEEKQASAATKGPTQSKPPLRGIICPHAGYSYSGPTAAFSYHHLQQELAKLDSPIERILVLHPSHHVYLDGCAVSGATVIETPVGDLPVDGALREEILQLKPGAFTVMEQGVDEKEHSGEMQYPYIAKVIKDANKNRPIPVLPIMCGSITTAKEAEYGKLLAPIVARRDVLCVISTDFCHWGRRFSYQPQPPPSSSSSMQIFEYIQSMDEEGMRHISMQEPGAFAKYLKETRNTICGRHAIQTWLNAVHCNNPDREILDIEFVKYAQSSPAMSLQDSSVSYASATARTRP